MRYSPLTSDGFLFDTMWLKSKAKVKIGQLFKDEIPKVFIFVSKTFYLVLHSCFFLFFVVALEALIKLDLNKLKRLNLIFSLLYFSLRMVSNGSD